MSVSTILWIIIIGGLFFWMMRRGGCGMMGHGGHGGHGSGGGQKGHSGHGEGSGRGSSLMIKDPVCGMFVDPQTSTSSQHMGKTFYFCDEVCKKEFDKEPMKYMKMETKGT
ncbi:MAG: YHS domain-containing protein [bacterium]